MSQASASEKPAPAAGPLTAAITGIGDPPQVDDRLVQRLGAAPHLGGQVDLLGLDALAGTRLTSPPAQKALPAPVTISARSGARSASQAKATVISPIISGLIALKASGRSRVRVPISPSISICSVFSSGGLRVSCSFRALSPSLACGFGRVARSLPFGRWPKTSENGASREPSGSPQQRRALPDSPGVYLFYDSDGRAALRRQGALDPQTGRLALLRRRDPAHLAGRPHRRPGHRQRGRGAARRAELHQAPPAALQHPPARRQVLPLRRASASTRTTRASTSPARSTAPDRAYFGPFSSAKRVRETLDLLGKLFQFRTCEGAEPGRRSGSPCLDYYIKRCGAPCVGYVSQEEYRRNIDAIVDFLSGRYRQVEARRGGEDGGGRRRRRNSSAPRSTATG